MSRASYQDLSTIVIGQPHKPKFLKSPLLQDGSKKKPVIKTYSPYDNSYFIPLCMVDKLVSKSPLLRDVSKEPRPVLYPKYG